MDVVPLDIAGVAGLLRLGCADLPNLSRNDFAAWLDDLPMPREGSAAPRNHLANTDFSSTGPKSDGLLRAAYRVRGRN